MERAIGKVRKERSDLLAERRRQDIMDQDKDCGEGPTMKLVLSHSIFVSTFSSADDCASGGAESAAQSSGEGGKAEEEKGEEGEGGGEGRGGDRGTQTGNVHR